MGIIQYLRTDNNLSAAGFIAARIISRLNQHNSVFWLVPGGSGMEVAAETAKLINSESAAKNITVSLTDERYGPVGHPDSNWLQLTDKGFRLDGAEMKPVLNGKDIITTANDYGRMLKDNLKKSDYTLALGGLGSDGHIFGIKPHSPAVESVNEVEAYSWEDYQRITPTAQVLSDFDEIIMYVMGEDKHAQLESLEREINPSIQPAQLLKRFKKVIIINDLKGEPL